MILNNFLKPYYTASFIAGWNVTVVNKTIKSLGVLWSDLSNQLNGGVRQYIVLARNTKNSELTAKIVPSNKTSSEIADLNCYTKYSVSVGGVNGDGMPYKSVDVLAMTKEWGELNIFDCNW